VSSPDGGSFFQRQKGTEKGAYGGVGLCAMLKRMCGGSLVPIRRPVRSDYRAQPRCAGAVGVSGRAASAFASGASALSPVRRMRCVPVIAGDETSPLQPNKSAA